MNGQEFLKEVQEDKFFYASLSLVLVLVFLVGSGYIDKYYSHFSINPESEFECQPKAQASTSVYTSESLSVTMTEQSRTMKTEPSIRGNTFLLTPPLSTLPLVLPGSKQSTSVSHT